MTHVLDNPVWYALAAPGRAARFDPDVSPFAAVRDLDDPAAWAELAALTAPGDLTLLAAPQLPPAPPGWRSPGSLAGVQLTGDAVTGAPEPEAVRLSAADVPEMLDLVARTEPGPFRKRTVELGGYLGVRRDGRLVAMAGRRLHPPGFVEISAVCTDPAYRGQGLAGRLTLAVAHGIRRDGATPVIHASATNTGAIRLYERLGFTLRTTMQFGAYEPVG